MCKLCGIWVHNQRQSCEEFWCGYGYFICRTHFTIWAYTSKIARLSVEGIYYVLISTKSCWGQGGNLDMDFFLSVSLVILSFVVL